MNSSINPYGVSLQKHKNSMLCDATMSDATVSNATVSDATLSNATLSHTQFAFYNVAQRIFAMICNLTGDQKAPPFHNVVSKCHANTIVHSTLKQESNLILS